MLGTAKDTIN